MRTFASLILAAALASGSAHAQGGFLGLSLGESPESGALVKSVELRSAASIMGLHEGDRITAVDGVAVADARALAALISARDPGEIVEVSLVREGAVTKLLGVLARRPGAARSAPRQPFSPETFQFPPLEMLRWNDAFMPQLEELRAQLDELQRQSSAWMQGPPTHVRLRYPESTPEAQREELRQQAIEKYGPQVKVEFAGTGTLLIMEHSMIQSPPSESQPHWDQDARNF